MASLPPNDPNRGNNGFGGNNNGGGDDDLWARAAAKEQPYDGRSNNRRGQRQRDGGGASPPGQQAGRDGQPPMDMIGDMSDSPVVVAMFLVGVCGWFLRTRCIC